MNNLFSQRCFDCSIEGKKQAKVITDKKHLERIQKSKGEIFFKQRMF